MTYSLLRLLIIVFLLLVLFLVFRKKFRNMKKSYKILVVIIILLFYFAIPLIPFENCLVSFPSPQEAFEYRFGHNKTKIEKIIVGKESACVFSVSDTCSFHSFPKEKGRYKLNNSIFGDNNFKIWGKYRITTCKSGNEKYILVEDMLLPSPTSDMKISDNQHSQFLQFSYRYEGLYEVCSYTIIDANIQNYKLIINGEEVTLS